MMFSNDPLAMALVFKECSEGHAGVPSSASMGRCGQRAGDQVLFLFQVGQLYFDQFHYIWASCKILFKRSVLLWKNYWSLRQSPHSWHDLQIPSPHASILALHLSLSSTYNELLTHHPLSNISWSLCSHCDIFTWTVFPLSTWKIHHSFISQLIIENLLCAMPCFKCWGILPILHDPVYDIYVVLSRQIYLKPPLYFHDTLSYWYFLMSSLCSTFFVFFFFLRERSISYLWIYFFPSYSSWLVA